MAIKRIHHVAYRCNDAKETVAFYRDLLGMDFQLAIAENEVPSTKAPDPYMHVFLDAGMGNVLAFFELPNSPKMDRDNNTPEWVQHIAFEVESMDELLESKTKLEAAGLDVLGPVNHTIFKSIYFFDPNGHRIELAAQVAKPGMMEELKRVSVEMLDEWAETKKAPQHAAWLHSEAELKKKFSGDK
ncbi:VOC family protein [Thalassotalea crassostreae]|uniref:VOC family protein n=1 Tax=Thalassotalea crassostreae TaxID=1763536 RepID=UPI000837CD0A|nr:VOC family protein [Thalassotalea crassostreae]